MHEKKKSKFSSSPPMTSDINEANALIVELWGSCTTMRTNPKLAALIYPNHHHPVAQKSGLKKVQSSTGRNPRGATQGHSGHKRQLSELKLSDTVVECYLDSTCSCCGDTNFKMSDKPFYRHQVCDFPITVMPLKKGHNH